MINHLILVAGGKGVRMGGNIPKQFLELKGSPILIHTLTRFIYFDKNINIILGIPHEYKKTWNNLCEKSNFTLKHQVVDGGENRFHTVKNCLDQIKVPGLVAIHDGVRPFISRQTIKKCFELAGKNGSAIPVIDIRESIRFIEGKNNTCVDRNKYKIVQTPQVFRSDIIKEAYSKAGFKDSFTDDASVVENAGYKIHLVEGNVENIKITTKEDLILAKEFVKKFH